MQQIELELEGGGVLTVSLRASLDAMPAVKQRPLVLVVCLLYTSDAADE